GSVQRCYSLKNITSTSSLPYSPHRCTATSTSIRHIVREREAFTMSDHDLADRAKTTKKHQDSLNSAKTEEDWLNTSSANSKPLTDQLASTGDTGTTNHYPVHTKTGAMNLTPRTILSLQ